MWCVGLRVDARTRAPDSSLLHKRLPHVKLNSREKDVVFFPPKLPMRELTYHIITTRCRPTLDWSSLWGDGEQVHGALWLSTLLCHRHSHLTMQLAVLIQMKSTLWNMLRIDHWLFVHSQFPPLSRRRVVGMKHDAGPQLGSGQGARAAGPLPLRPSPSRAG